MKHTLWLDRKFPVIEDDGLLPNILERLIGTPFRLDGMIHSMDPKYLILKATYKWSAQEEIGHLIDLEPLWLTRIHEILDGVPQLTAADMSNQNTSTANHNEKLISDVLSDFKTNRSILTDSIKNLNPEHLQKTSFHPRLKRQMSITDLAYFIAEHDDHHMANIRNKIKNINF